MSGQESDHKTEMDQTVQREYPIIAPARTKGIASASKKEGRATSEGLVSSYIHGGGKVGVLIEVACETDFVARTDDFQEFVRNVAMHIAAASPIAVTREEVDSTLIEKLTEKGIEGGHVVTIDADAHAPYV